MGEKGGTEEEDYYFTSQHWQGLLLGTDPTEKKTHRGWGLNQIKKKKKEHARPKRNGELYHV